jgi:hypothetical protein
MFMSREKGDILEDLVAHALGINKTTNSGAKFDNADLTNRQLIIECKVKSKQNFQPCGSEIKKLIAQAKKHSKEWIYIQENLSGKFVVIDWEYFLELFQQ